LDGQSPRQMRARLDPSGGHQDTIRCRRFPVPPQSSKRASGGRERRQMSLRLGAGGIWILAGVAACLAGPVPTRAAVAPPANKACVWEPVYGTWTIRRTPAFPAGDPLNGANGATGTLVHMSATSSTTASRPTFRFAAQRRSRKPASWSCIRIQALGKVRCTDPSAREPRSLAPVSDRNGRYGGRWTDGIASVAACSGSDLRLPGRRGSALLMSAQGRKAAIGATPPSGRATGSLGSYVVAASLAAAARQLARRG
jgi:hypothetical protein